MRHDDGDSEAIQPYRPGLAPTHASADSRDPQELPNIAKERLTTFFGAELRESRPWPIMIVLFALVGLAGSVVGAYQANWTLLTGLGLAPLVLALALGLTWPRALRVQITPDGLVFAPRRYVLKYDQIHHVFAPQRDRSSRFAIHLLCDGGYITLSKRLNANSEDLYRFLRSQPLAQHALPDHVDPAFHAFLRQQLALHGAERITVFQTRRWHERQLIGSWTANGSLRAALAIFSAALVLIAGAFVVPAPNGPVLAVPGAIGLFVSLICLITGVSGSSRRRVRRKLQGSMLFVTPTGLALAQGDLRGELRWSEILKIKRQRPGGFHLSSADMAPGVGITVKGAVLVIEDIYQWPPEHIEFVIRSHSGL